jgi:hypothetical protein
LPAFHSSADCFGAAFLSEAALVRYFYVLATLMLTACALPGASGGNSFMSAMHPTQDFCESRGLTLDATTKQCASPPKTAASPEGVTGSLPQGASAQKTASPSSQPAPANPSPVTAVQPPAPPQPPPPQERQRAEPKVPVEPDAVIYSQFAQNFELMSELAHFVRASGYRCDSISALDPVPGGYKLICNRASYKYAIEEKNGRSIVTAE